MAPPTTSGLCSFLKSVFFEKVRSFPFPLVRLWLDTTGGPAGASQCFLGLDLEFLNFVDENLQMVCMRSFFSLYIFFRI